MNYSFDVFDTCLTRTYAHPTDLFYDLALLMLVEKNQFYCQSDVNKLAKFRIISEKKARKIAEEKAKFLEEEIFV